jgi:hypothetical protein
MKQFSVIRSHILDLYGQEISRIQSELKSTDQDQAKRELFFSQLHSLTYSRLVTALVASNILLLLARVEVCLIGRANRISATRPEDGTELSEEERRGDHRELLSALRLLSSRETTARIDRVCRKLFSDGRWSEISPTAVIKSSKIESVLTSTVSEILSELSSGTAAKPSPASSPISMSAWSWLLGKLATPSSSSAEDGGPTNGISTIVCETLDVIESPQFSAVLQYIVRGAIHLSLQRSIPANGNRDKGMAAALLMPGIRMELDNVLTKSGPYYEQFKATKIVDEFCQSVYMSDSGATGAEADIMEALQNASSSSSSSTAGMDDAQIEKLGKLLEQLVRADINK